MTLRVLWEDFSLKSDAALQKVYELPILARRLTVNINDYNTADTFDAEIDYKNFPFDPRAIRSCGVTIHIEDKGQVFKGNNALNLIQPTPENAVFQGFVDEESISFDEDKRTVRFEGRDFTSLLIDSKYLEGKPVDTGTPLDRLIQELLNQIKATEKIKVDNRTGKELPTLKQFFPDFGQPLAGQKNVGRDDTYWEIITDLVQKAGLICFIELDKLVISTPRVLYDKSNAKKFIYGRNIQKLEFKRKLGRHKGFNVAVRYLDLATKEVLLAKIPEEASDDFVTRTGQARKRIQIPVINPDGTLGEPKDAPFITFRVTNVKNKAHLTEIGEKIYEEMSRQQLEGTFNTKEMCTTDAKNNEFDILKLRVATPVEITIDQGDMKGLDALAKRFEHPGGVVDVKARTREIAKFLKARCYEDDVAEALAKTYGKMSPTFYTKAASFSLDAEQGFSLKVDFLNFIDLDNKGIDFG